VFYFLSIFALSLFDIIATHYQIISYNSFEVEANPIMKWVMYQWGITDAYIFRMILPTLGVPFLLYLRSKSNAATWALNFILWVHILLAGWHLYITNFFNIHG